MAVSVLDIAKVNTDKTVYFGWELPSGNRRMPVGAENYMPSVRRRLDHINGHFHSAWIPDHFMNKNHDDYPESLVSCLLRSCCGNVFDIKLEDELTRAGVH